MVYYPANKRYVKKNILHVMVGFNRKTEPEITDYIEQMENRSGYIKRLIREDMERNSKK